MIREFKKSMMQKIQQILTGTFLAAFFVVSMFNTIALAELPEIDAKQVAVNVDEREDGDDETAELEMILINDKGQERNRKVQVYRKDYGKDSKMVMFFMEPADVKDTGFLSWNYDDESKDDDQWLYLPALKKVRRISSSKKKDYFMGTDFTYEDMGDRDVDDYTYKHLGTEILDGIECYHLEMTPKNDDIVKKTGYGRGEMWARPDIWMGIKMKFYDKKLKFLKELTLSDVEQINGIWTAKTMTMVNEQEKHKTVFHFSNITYNSGLDDDIFSQRRLEKGIQ
ncbi:hypothetical protein U27_03026 [Candidatus Vecturithrix granuli]|uniref:Uncharacterized protein TP-0789 domain-containing protein n=1 Tax=Vecturithrix granuli TaxID=1499967 RepID=A0A081BUQ9_VECG1|nr:hypothetical protein U27_03026 [Candidatus Vecturithrix granuli]